MILVTGGAGFIGSNFVIDWLAASGEPVVNLDKLTYAGNLANLASLAHDERHVFVHGDIADRELLDRLFATREPRAVVHFAAESHVDRSIHGPAAFVRTNVVGTFELLEAARSYWQGLGPERKAGFRFLNVSTDEVYGSLGPTDPAFHERTPYAPNSPYSASKAASDHLVRAYHHTYGLNVTISNCSNNYGQFHFPEKLIPLMIVNILHGRALPVYGDGRNVRDWLHVSDHCRAIELILAKGIPGEVYNVGGGAESENIELVHMLCAAADAALAADPELGRQYPDCPAAGSRQSATLIKFVPDRPGHDRRYAIDCAKIEHELGYRAGTRLADGLRATFEWYVRNPAWWRRIMDGSYQQWIETNYQER
jgi:dTDP-glucose 4,6-dehydratase